MKKGKEIILDEIRQAKQTSNNDEHKCLCDCHAFIGGSGKPCPNCKAEFRQGYAKALEKFSKVSTNYSAGFKDGVKKTLDDVGKIIDGLCLSEYLKSDTAIILDRLIRQAIKQEIAKLGKESK